MSYEETVGDIAKVVEAFGVAILVIGAAGAFALYVRDVAGKTATHTASYGAISAA